MKTRSKFISKILSVTLVLTCIFAMGITSLTANATEKITEKGSEQLQAILDEPVADITFNKIDPDTGDETPVEYTLKTLEYYNALTGKKEKNVALYVVDGNTFTFNATEFKQMEGNLQEKALLTFAKCIKRYDMSARDKQAIYDEIRYTSSEATAAMISVIFEDSKADMFGALTLFQPFSSTFGIIMGVGVLLLMLMIALSTVMDLVYIGVPVFREMMTSKSEGKNGGMGGNSQGGKPWGISADAYSVVQEVEGGGGGSHGGMSGGSGGGKYQNGYVLYFRRRVLTYIVLAICLLYLISGQLANVIAWLIGLVDGFKF